MEHSGKPYIIAAGLVAGTAGAVVLARKANKRRTSMAGQIGKYLVAGILGRRVLWRLGASLVKKSVQLEVCRMRLNQGGFHGHRSAAK